MLLKSKTRYSVDRVGLFWRAVRWHGSTPVTYGPRRWRATLAWDDLLTGRLP